MHRVRYHKRVLKTLKQIPGQRAAQIIEAVDSLAAMDDPTIDPNVKIMRGQWEGSWRLRVGSYRVIFQLLPDDSKEEILFIFVAAIGSRGDAY